MKKILLIAFIFFCNYGYTQEFKYEEKSVTGIFEAQGKSKSEIFSAINKWISINYNSSKNVIQMNDLESGTIIVRGINTIVTKDFFRSMLSPGLQKSNAFNTMTYNFSHLIEINIKDNKYRVKYIITKYEDFGSDNPIFKRVNFAGGDNNLAQDYYSLADSLIELYMINIKNKQAMRDIMKPMLDEMNSSLLIAANSTLNSIYNEAIKKNDNW